MFAWLTEASNPAKRALLAASLGWMLDAFDVMLYSLVLAPLMRDLPLTKTAAGGIGSATLVAAAAGGLLFGVIADRCGRVTALRWSILIYAVFTAACGFAQNAVELLIFRILLGFGMGGEWASGASLVSETWPAEHRGKALGLMQSSWAVGYALAALTAAVIMPFGGWRAVFFVGVVPALFTIWIRRKLTEPEAWKRANLTRKSVSGGLGELVRKPLRKLTFCLTVMNACTLFAWWGFNVWLAAYLSLPATQGGLGFTPRTMTVLIVSMEIGMWFGYVTFGYASDRIGRKTSYVLYLLVAAGALIAYSFMRSPIALLVLGPIVAFFGTGYFSGFGTVTAEIYETRIRATAQGFTYNAGRLASAAAPFAMGTWAVIHGFSSAFRLAALFFCIAAAFWIWIPETRAIPVKNAAPAG